METVIIGIHGLRNKPPKYLLTSWWKKSLIEGFTDIELPAPRFTFEMAYWAHYMHVKSQNPQVTDSGDPQYLEEPYLPGTWSGPRERKTFRSTFTQGLNQEIMRLIAGKNGFMNADTISNIILHRMFIELDVYYHKRLRDGYGRLWPARELIRQELAACIRKHRHKSIMIIAHSMGSIIAYDVLLHAVADIPVHTLITIGSPLGFPVILKKIRHELHSNTPDDTPLPTPPSIKKRWLNIADLDDVTCMDYNLRSHYRKNSSGVRPFDQIVFNNYEYNGTHNPHKAYGYLRTAEVTHAVNQFLTVDNADFWQRLKWILGPPRM
jgi:hypothetical protein